ncbi:MAG: KpsF/GutQ family sugar-phosphate isomerase [Acidobacteria bacterium]|nr:KpsF/GutQ family sugar-phosphate isomerase [Acidobacteriota bacterium]
MKEPTPAGVDLELARAVLRTEADAVRALIPRLDARFAAAVQLLADCNGRVIVSGMGKSGIIARKIAATLSSTGTPAYFVHPAEAAHGDLGAVHNEDLLIALSRSGRTPEILRLAELTKRLGVRIIAITGAASSPLGQTADAALECRVDEEACPLNLAPTASTTAALALGDALAMTLHVRKGFREEDFANLHPGGQLGKRLLRIDRLMHTSDQLPLVDETTPLRDVVETMSSKGFGTACVTRGDATLAGIITDGDLRRRLSAAGSLLDLRADEVMTKDPVTIRPGALAAEALAILEERRITSLIVVDDARRVAGIVHLHDLWRTELF